MENLKEKIIEALPQIIEGEARGEIAEKILSKIITIQSNDDKGAQTTEILADVLGRLISSQPSVVSRLVSMKALPKAKKKGKSLKPYNLLINWKSAYAAGPGIAVAVGAAAMAAPILTALGIFAAMIPLYQAAEKSLDSDEVVVLWALWRLAAGDGDISDSENRIVSGDDLYVSIQTIARSGLKADVDEQRITEALSELTEIRCIKKLGENEYRLIEEVSVSYE